MAETARADGVKVELFRQILFWPLQLMPLADQDDVHWKALDGAPFWRLLEEDFPENPGDYQERHYREFIAFLPQVQRFLYGEKSAARSSYGDSPLRTYRRDDIKSVRLKIPGDAAPITFRVDHLDVCFFFDADVMIPVVEISGENLDLGQAMEMLNRFGRAYPAGWSVDGDPASCFELVEWLDAEGVVLSRADYAQRPKFFRAVARDQLIEIAAHWEFMLKPMQLNRRGAQAGTRYRPLEFHRMPLMAFLAVPEPTQLTRPQLVRLAYATRPAAPDILPFSASHLGAFEQDHCYDRLWQPGRDDPGWINVRMLCTPQAFVMVGPSGDSAFTDWERGYLGQFRHQYFMLGLIAHFHRAAILMMSNRLVEIIGRLKTGEPRSVARFRRDIRRILAQFLRFTHRYYFTEISDQLVLRDIFRLWSNQLGSARLYAELREEVSDMEAYMEADLLRRQAVTILQLTVVTLFSLIGAVTTGFLGMNIFAYTDEPAWTRFGIFLVVFVPTTALTLYTVRKSRRLAFFLDALADERVSWKHRLAALLNIWRGESDG